MKIIFTLLFVLGLTSFVNAQKVDYKSNIISVNGNEIGKVEVEKKNLGLTKNFNFYSVDGKKLIIAVLSTEFENEKHDNTFMYYRFTFLPTNQVGVFKLSSLAMEKGFVNLIGKANIIENGTLNAEKVTEFIATKGVSPRNAVIYSLVSRNKRWPIELKESKDITQGGEVIGFFKYTGTTGRQETYEFFVPEGIMIAKVRFAGGNNARNFDVFTARDRMNSIISIPPKEQTKIYSSPIDPNALALKRITNWLVENGYL